MVCSKVIDLIIFNAELKSIESWGHTHTHTHDEVTLTDLAQHVVPFAYDFSKNTVVTSPFVVGSKCFVLCWVFFVPPCKFWHTVTNLNTLTPLSQSPRLKVTLEHDVRRMHFNFHKPPNPVNDAEQFIWLFLLFHFIFALGVDYFDMVVKYMATHVRTLMFVLMAGFHRCWLVNAWTWHLIHMTTELNNFKR